MSLLLVFLLAIVSVASTLVLFNILFTSPAQWFEAEYLEEDLRALEVLENSREKLVRQLRDLELDYSMNKVSKEDYETYKTRFERQAVAIAKRIDQVMGGREWNQKVELLLQKEGISPEVIDSTEVEETVEVSEKTDSTKITEESSPEEERKDSAEVEQIDCECGERISCDDNFCRSCGKRVIVALILLCTLVTPNFFVGELYAQDLPVEDSVAKVEHPPAQKNDANRDSYTITVSVKDTKNQPLSDQVIFLRATRARGPFETTAPPAQHEWTGLSDKDGFAHFDVPVTDVEGLRLQAVMSFDGQAYESYAEVPENNLKLDIRTFEITRSIDKLQIKNLRIIVQLWEGYVTFIEYYSFANTGDKAIDLGNLPGEEFEKGLPIKLPLKAKGIEGSGVGQSQVVQSTLYWSYFLKPGEVANLQVRFSISETGKTFVYEQKTDYLIDNVEVIVPIMTEFRKVPRLADVALDAPKFANVGSTDENSSPLGLRPDVDFIAAWGLKVEPGESFIFRLRGLPFKEKTLPWLIVTSALVVGLVLLGIGLRFARGKSITGREEQLEILRDQRDEFLLLIQSLNKDFDEGNVEKAYYNARLKELKQRLALILTKLELLEREEGNAQD